MRHDTPWRRVTRAESCPICERPDWCLLAGPIGNPTAVICARIESLKRCGEAGWLHRLQDDDTWQRMRRRTARVTTAAPTTRVDFVAMAERCAAAIRPVVLRRLGESLGLSVESLLRLRVGWSAEHRATTWPMTNATGDVLGIRLRFADGRKLSVRGGREGMFLPADLSESGPLLVCEGPTDTAAMLDLSFAAAGRPSCTGGVRLLVEVVRRRPATEVIIVADSDTHGAGRRGAENLATVLVAYSHSVRVIEPVIGNDARDWLGCGATHADVLTAIHAAPVRRLPINTRKAGGYARIRR